MVKKLIETRIKLASSPSYFFIILCSLLPIAFTLLYIESYKVNVPINDGWGFSMPIAVKAVDGNLKLDDLFVVLSGHRLFFTGLLTAFLAVTTHWNLEYENYASFILAVLNFLMLVSMIRFRRWNFLSIVPISALIFSLRQQFNWVWGAHNSIYFVVFFFLAALLIVDRQPVRWRTLILAGILALCSTFSLAHGLVAWPALFVVIWMRGYRKWQYFAFWLALTVIIPILFVSGSDIAVGSTSSQPNQSVKFTNLFTILKFAIAYVGSPLIYSSSSTSIFVTLIGITLLLVNLAYLWLTKERLADLAVWIGMAAFGTGDGLFVALTREEMGIQRALEYFYVTHTTLFWIPLTVILLHVLNRFRGIVPTSRESLLLMANASTIVVMIFLYFYANYRALVASSIFHNHVMLLDRSDSLPEPEECLLKYPVSGFRYCEGVQGVYYSTALIDHLAARRLSVFADQKPTLFMPSPYKSGDPIIIETPWSWLNDYIHDMYLKGVGANQIYNVITAGTGSPLPFPEEPIGIGTHDIDQAISDIKSFLNDATQVWYISYENQGMFASEANRILEGYIRVNTVDLGRVQIVEYLRSTPQTVQNPYSFENTVDLQAWNLGGSVQVKPCQELTVQSWWSTRSALQGEYSMTLVIANGEGQGVASNDGAPLSGRVSSWEPNRSYPDQKQITVPCDIQPGEYNLLVSLYRHDPLDTSKIENLPATLPDGAPVGNYAYLTTIFVGEHAAQ